MTQVGGDWNWEAGRSSPETISCGSPFDGLEFELKNWACMPGEDQNIEARDGDYGSYGGGFAGVEFDGAEPMMKKGPWTAEEDEKLKKCVEEHGVGNWITIEKCSGLGRTSKSCRLRWTNHLRPHLKKGSFTREEERILVKLHKIYGNKWSYIASKLPGRTDNEVKNFWHGRVRRCLRKFQPIYPENIEDEYHNSTSMVDAESGLLFPSISSQSSLHDPSFIQLPNAMNNQNPAFTFTSPETQFFSPHQRPVSSPHSLPSSLLPSPTYYTAQMPPSPMTLPSHNCYCSVQQFRSSEVSDTTSQNPCMSIQEHFLSPQQSVSKTAAAIAFTPLRPPPILSSMAGRLKRSRGTCNPMSSSQTKTQFSGPEQGSQISASGSSITSLKMNVASPIPQTLTQFHSPKLLKSTEQPLTSYEQLHISSMPSDVCSSDLNSQSLNASTMHPKSCLQKSQSAPSFVFPQACDSFIFEPPSVQTPTSAYRPIPETNKNLPGTNVEIVAAQTQEANANADILRQNLLEEKYVNQSPSLIQDLPGKMSENETYQDNVFHQSSMPGGICCEKTGRLIHLDQSLIPEHTATKMSNNRDLVNQRSGKIPAHKKCLKPEGIEGKISRREGLLSEISKTGVLLVERGKKEMVLQGLLDKDSRQGASSSNRSKTEEVELAEISNREPFGQNFITNNIQSEINNRKDYVNPQPEKNVSINNQQYVNLVSSTTQNFEETFFGTGSRKSISLDLQKQTCDQDAFGRDSRAISRRDDMLASRGQEDEFKTLHPKYIHNTEMHFTESGDLSDNLKHSSGYILCEYLGQGCPDTFNGESWSHQAQDGAFVGENSLVDNPSQDQQETLNKSTLSFDQCPMIWSSVQQCGDDFFKADVRKEVSSGKSLENNIAPDNGTRERFQPVNSSDRTITLKELCMSEFVSSTMGSNAVHHQLTDSTHCNQTCSSQCYKEPKMAKEKIEEPCDILAEDLSDFLEFCPTNLPDWYGNNSDENSSISDLIFGLEMRYNQAIDEMDLE